MSMSAKALKAALAMNNTIVAQAEKIAEMQCVIDGAVREGVYCKDGHWWNELCRLSTYTPNKACTRRAGSLRLNYRNLINAARGKLAVRRKFKIIKSPPSHVIR